MSEIPFVIDNESEDKRLCKVLNDILSDHEDKSLDIASAYFNVYGYKMIKEGLDNLGSLRLLLGYEPHHSEDIGVKPDKKKLLKQMHGDLEELPFDEDFLLLVEDLIRLLREDYVAVRLYQDGFLHAKSYLFYHDKVPSPEVFDRYMPYVGIVGSSNFTRGGLYSNKELNLVHKAKLSDTDVNRAIRTSQKVDKAFDHEIFDSDVSVNKLMSSVGASAIADLSEWFEKHWDDSRDFKEDLIELLNTSKFGEYEYTPHQIYMKTLFNYFKDDLESSIETYKKSAIDLTEFQEDAVKKCRKILMKYNGVMVADSVGLGKTWIAKKLLEDYGYHMRQKVLVVPPASLKPMWKEEMSEAGIPAQFVTQEKLGREDFDPSEYGDVDVILIDE
ncbi:MAG: phospholipase D-like domain-containing protein, partial [Thermoplasmatota archaeon]